MDWHLSHYISKAQNFEQELDISILGTDGVMENEHYAKYLSLLKKRKAGSQSTSDPLTENEYTDNGCKMAKRLKFR